MVHPVFLYLPGVRLSLAELSAARIDGHVVEVGDAYVPADLPEGAHVRASTVASLVQAGTAASGPTAAWIHGAGDAPPNVHHVRRCVERRIRAATSSRLVFHDTVVPASDLGLIGGVPVTTPVRTMLDLATAVHRDPRVLTWMDRLALVFPDASEAAADSLRRMSRVPGSRAGRAVLDRLSVKKR
ncbi:hypothetical protein RN51_02918 [Microbacterium oxydans]|uniref:AbiEi antitoxin C-terminal domain-containing protein n=1 Tax=Microbacterium oxydans TaxID=82380 RepID=A0A0F0KHE8_9MICO|nr:hypothetical protein RN51_02918 [Microbacterium oxydans]